MKYLINSPELIPRRRLLRKEQTEAERRLWNAINNRQLSGVKFRRQFSVGHYILDFYCAEKKLCIELDGGQHASAGEYDQARSEYLAGNGIRVVRFWNNDVLQNLEGVVQELSRHL
jgi:adenine-specific DNA-methyltransferase